MKKIFSLAMFASLIVLFGCTKSTPSETTTPVENEQVTELQSYESKTDKFAIKYPGAWTFEENVFGSSVMFFTPLTEGDLLKENVGIIKKALDKTYSLDEYYAITKPELKTLIPNFVEVSKENITINGIDAQKLIYQGTQGDVKLQWEQIYLIKDQTVYVITYTASQDTFTEFSQQIDDMAATLEIK